MIKKFIIVIWSIMAINNSNAQGTIVNILGACCTNDPCADQLMDAGCTKQTKSYSITPPSLISFCAGAQINIIIQELWCNGTLRMSSLVSSGIVAPPGSPCNTPTMMHVWAMGENLQDYLNRQILGAYPGLKNAIVASGATCKAEVEFDMPAFNVTRYNTSNGTETPYTVTIPASHFKFKMSCKTDECCFAEVTYDDNGNVVSQTPTNVGGNGCPNALTAADVQLFFKQTWEVQSGAEGLMTGLTISPCVEDCNINAGQSDPYAWKSTAGVSTADQTLQAELGKYSNHIWAISSNATPISYQIFNLEGKLIEASRYSSNYLDFSRYSKGLYFVNIQFEKNQMKSFKVDNR